MKYKLLSVNNVANSTTNIGDYIQALASFQYYPRLDGFVDRENLSNYDGDECKIIMNGWYMHRPNNWPPSPKILPLFVAFHINSFVSKELTTKESLEYLHKYEPIGCRDTWTTELLKNNGIDSYFSGCMTLTLGKKYCNSQKEQVAYIVDPIIPCKLSLMTAMKSFLYFVQYPTKVIKLLRKKNLFAISGKSQFKGKIKKFIKTAIYYKLYSKIMTDDLILSAEYVSHESTYYKNSLRSDEERLKEAEKLIMMYAKAQLVLTSRIHCALPCLGIETPVIFLQKKNDLQSSACRFGGLTDLFNKVEVDIDTIIPQFSIRGKLSIDNHPHNKESWRMLAESLDERCFQFMKEN